MIPSGSVWPSSSIRGFVIRHPSVVSKTSRWPVANALSGFGITHGERLIDSTPPAM